MLCSALSYLAQLPCCPALQSMSVFEPSCGVATAAGLKAKLHASQYRIAEAEGDPTSDSDGMVTSQGVTTQLIH